MTIKVICVGKIKENYFKDAINEYIKRLSSYCNISIVEVEDESINKNSSLKEDEKVKNAECSRILSKIGLTDFVVALDLNSKEYTSESWAKHFDSLLTTSRGKLVFVIGGSLGLNEDIKKRANERVSLSQMTFTHQMTRLILLETIYRSYKILNNETYHK